MESTWVRTLDDNEAGKLHKEDHLGLEEHTQEQLAPLNELMVLSIGKENT